MIYLSHPFFYNALLKHIVTANKRRHWLRMATAHDPRDRKGSRGQWAFKLPIGT